MASKTKRAALGAHPPAASKTPRVGFSPDDPEIARPVWRFHLMDFDGPWSWNNVDATMLRSIRDRLANFESMTWKELEASRAGNCGPMPVSEICQEAFRRLQALKLDDHEVIYKFRITSAGRVWGVRSRSIVQLLWWDPNHTVYPMNIAGN